MNGKKTENREVMLILAVGMCLSAMTYGGVDDLMQRTELLRQQNYELKNEYFRKEQICGRKEESLDKIAKYNSFYEQILGEYSRNLDPEDQLEELAKMEEAYGLDIKSIECGPKITEKRLGSVFGKEGTGCSTISTETMLTVEADYAKWKKWVKDICEETSPYVLSGMNVSFEEGRVSCHAVLKQYAVGEEVFTRNE